jgi:leucyl/phenylalanyl-tRNA--protein transferase
MFMLNADSADLRFPPVELASPEGLLAIGGDLRAERLLEAYRHGIFPWYSEGQPILWWSPDPRAVLVPERIKISRSLRKTLRAGRFEISVDTAFRDVIQACAGPRRGHSLGGTWITPEMIEAYGRLHELGYAHSIETRYRDGADSASGPAGNGAAGQLVGGLYGVALGGVFFGESMFSGARDASKVALACLAAQLEDWGFLMIDCQMPTEHLTSLGAVSMRRREFLDRLERALAMPTRRGSWHFDIGMPMK